MSIESRSCELCGPKSSSAAIIAAFHATGAVYEANKRRRKDAFAKEVLQDVRDAKAGLESVGRLRIAEIMRENAFADEPGYPAEQNSGRYQHRKVGTDADCPAPRLYWLLPALRADFGNFLSQRGAPKYSGRTTAVIAPGGDFDAWRIRPGRRRMLVARRLKRA